MKELLFLVTAIAAFSFFAGGCQSVPEDESTIPWSQPQSWENDRMPGVGR